MKRLIATRPILYMGKTYERGKQLPAFEEKMVEAWLRAGSAVWREDKIKKTEKSSNEPIENA